LTTKQFVEQIEGEASIYFDIKDDKVEFATITFPHFRGMESILKGKSALDALVITPRVCGICGHAHLMATVRALEDVYKNSSNPVSLSTKAEVIREFTLVIEMIQNHFKWIYLSIIPELIKLTQTTRIQTPLKGAYASSLASKAIAVFAGQWPHSSYMLPGGITSDPTNIDILKATSYLDELILFFEKETLGVTLEQFLSFESCKDFASLQSDVGFIESTLIDVRMNTKGFAYDRFLVIGKHNFSKPSKMKHTRSFHVESALVKSVKPYAPQEKSFALNAVYKDDYYETGPLARSMSNAVPVIKNIHRRFKDSAYSRVMARVFELASLMQEAKLLLEKIDITQPSYNKPVDFSKISGSGVGVVEAPRGPLLHRVEVQNGVITSYEIITPTQFNIGSSTQENPTPAQKAMIGVSEAEAMFIFKTFDVCSVCTTH